MLAANSPGRFVAGRVVGIVVTLLVTSFVVFGALSLTPGSQIGYLLGGRPATPAAIREVIAQYHLNEPFIPRYLSYLGGLLHGDLGRSLVFRDNVSSLLAPRLGTTVFLVVFASLLILVIGVALGTLAGLTGGVVDRAVILLSTAGLATPGFVAAIVLITVFAVNLGWFPVSGPGSGFAGHLWHLTLPAVALALSGLALVARVTRTAVRAETGREHVETAHARGIPQGAVIRRHVLRNAMIPISTVSSLTIGGLIAGSVVIETAFGLNGIGSFLVSSVNSKDYAVVQAITILLVGAFVVLNTGVDLLYVAIDPRVRPWARR